MTTNSEKAEKSAISARDSGSEPAYKRVAKTVLRGLLGVLIAEPSPNGKSGGRAVAEQQVRSVWKYPMTGPITKLDLPGGAEILTVQLQSGEPMLWAKVDPDAITTESRTFIAVGTGQAIHDAHPLAYVATFQTEEGLVWHVFEVDRPRKRIEVANSWR